MQKLKKLEERIGYRFKDFSLLETAMTHSSYAHERNIQSYERLEFLGDAVLNFTVAVEIFRSHPDKDEHFLTDLKSAYVNRNYLHRLGKKLGIGEILRHSGPRNIRLDQAVEALIGAIYIDGGYLYAKNFIKKFILSKEIKPLKDYKGLIKTVSMKIFNKDVVYKVEKEFGPPHMKRFQITAKIPGEKISATAIGRTKREAEMKTSKILLRKLGYPPPNPHA